MPGVFGRSRSRGPGQKKWLGGVSIGWKSNDDVVEIIDVSNLKDLNNLTANSPLDIYLPISSVTPSIPTPSIGDSFELDFNIDSSKLPAFDFEGTFLAGKGKESPTEKQHMDISKDGGSLKRSETISSDSCSSSSSINTENTNGSKLDRPRRPANTDTNGASGSTRADHSAKSAKKLILSPPLIDSSSAVPRRPPSSSHCGYPPCPILPTFDSPRNNNATGGGQLPGIADNVGSEAAKLNQKWEEGNFEGSTFKSQDSPLLVALEPLFSDPSLANSENPLEAAQNLLQKGPSEIFSNISSNNNTNSTILPHSLPPLSPSLLSSLLQHSNKNTNIPSENSFSSSFSSFSSLPQHSATQRFDIDTLVALPSTNQLTKHNKDNTYQPILKSVSSSPNLKSSYRSSVIRGEELRRNKSANRLLLFPPVKKTTTGAEEILPTEYPHTYSQKTTQGSNSDGLGYDRRPSTASKSSSNHSSTSSSDSFLDLTIVMAARSAYAAKSYARRTKVDQEQIDREYERQQQIAYHQQQLLQAQSRQVYPPPQSRQAYPHQPSQPTRVSGASSEATASTNSSAEFVHLNDINSLQTVARQREEAELRRTRADSQGDKKGHKKQNSNDVLESVFGVYPEKKPMGKGVSVADVVANKLFKWGKKEQVAAPSSIPTPATQIVTPRVRQGSGIAPPPQPQIQSQSHTTPQLIYPIHSQPDGYDPMDREEMMQSRASNYADQQKINSLLSRQRLLESRIQQLKSERDHLLDFSPNSLNIPVAGSPIPLQSHHEAALPSHVQFQRIPSIRTRAPSPGPQQYMSMSSASAARALVDPAQKFPKRKESIPSGLPIQSNVSPVKTRTSRQFPPSKTIQPLKTTPMAIPSALPRDASAGAYTTRPLPPPPMVHPSMEPTPPPSYEPPPVPYQSKQVKLKLTSKDSGITHQEVIIHPGDEDYLESMQSPRDDLDTDNILDFFEDLKFASTGPRGLGPMTPLPKPEAASDVSRNGAETPLDDKITFVDVKIPPLKVKKSRFPIDNNHTKDWNAARKKASVDKLREMGIEIENIAV